MRIFQGFDFLPHFAHPAVTVGSYDGVHLGHQKLLARLLEEARLNGGESVVLTFDPHPRIALGKADGMLQLTTLDEKAELLQQAGVDNLIVVPFNQTFGALSGLDFVEQYLIRRIDCEILVAGYNHRFGHDRCDCTGLKTSRELKIVQVGACDIDGLHVSSTVIRNLIADGDYAQAEKLLGHPIGARIKNLMIW